MPACAVCCYAQTDTQARLWQPGEPPADYPNSPWLWQAQCNCLWLSDLLETCDEAAAALTAHRSRCTPDGTPIFAKSG